MRVSALLTVLLAVLLAACGKQPAPATGGAPGAAPARPSGPEVTGTVIFSQPVQLSAGSTLNVRLLDVTRVESQPQLITEATLPIRQVPAEFALPYNTAEINPIRTFAVEATVMEGGQVRFLSEGRVGVITQGKPTRVNVKLTQALVQVVKDPAVEMQRAYADFESRLGALDRITGSRIVGENTAIGWDAFVDETGVRMVREQIVNDAESYRAEQIYAWQESGKPWMVTKKAGGATIRVGFDEAGTPVVQQRNGQAGTIDQKDIDALLEAGRKARSIAKAQAGGGR